MDFTKLKISRLFAIVLCVITTRSVLGQSYYEIPIFVTINNISDPLSNAGLVAYPNAEFSYCQNNSVYRSAFEGYNRIVANDKSFLIHFEEFDDFNAAVFKNDSTTTLIYSGAQGAIKNEFLLRREKAFNDFIRVPGLLKKSKEDFSRSMDSLVDVWKEELSAYPFTELFQQDEKVFYETFAGYTKIRHQMSVDNLQSIDQVAIEKFPKLDYRNYRHYVTMPLYSELAVRYHKKIAFSKKSFEETRQYLEDLNKISNKLLVFEIRKEAFSLATEHHPQAEEYYEVAKADPYYRSRYRKIYRRVKKTGKGSDFEFPKGQTIDGTVMDFERFSGKNVYLYAYLIKDPNLRYNLTAWNRLSLSNKEPDTYFVAYALDGDLYQDTWKSMQMNSQIAGLSIKTSIKDSNEFKDDLGMILTPRIIVIGKDGNVMDPNLDASFKKTGF